MEGRGSIPPGLPRDGPTTSYWQSPPDEIAGLRSTENLPLDADIVIVGSGISGASIAFNLLREQPEKKIVLLEARQAASGASGRNGGHTKGASYRFFLDNFRLVGAEDAIKIAKLEYNCMTAVHAFIAEHDIACDARRCDTVDVFYDLSEWSKGQESVQLMRKLMPDHPASKYTFHSPEETATRFHCPNSLGSISYAAGSLSAYAFTIGVLKLALTKGLNLQTTTPALSLSKSSDGSTDSSWTINTPRGPITARTVLLATNGYTAHLLPQLQGVIVPFRGHVTAQRPGRSLPQAGCLDTTYSFIYKGGYEYMITRPVGSKNAGDVVIGGGLIKAKDDGVYEYGCTDDTALDGDVMAWLMGSAAGYFGEKNWGEDHMDGRLRHVHSGIMGYSGDGYPLVGAMPGMDGVWVQASFQGHGMVLCFLCSEALVRMVVGGEKGGKGGEGLDAWFPAAFRMGERRLGAVFRGRGVVKKVEENKVNGVHH